MASNRPDAEKLAVANTTVELEDIQGPKIDRRTAVKLLGAAGVTGLAGCLGDDADDTDPADDDDDDEQPDDDIYGGHFTLATLQDGTDLMEPGYTTGTQVGRLLNQASNGLLTVTEDLEIVGDIAHDWETDDGQTYTFHLRDDVVFHTGRGLVADDFVRVYERGMEQGDAVLIQRELGDRVPDDGVTAIDDYTLEIQFNEVLAPGLSYLVRNSRALNPTDLDALDEMDEEDFQMAPPMTGPYEIVEHQVDSHVELERFDDYWKEDDQGRQLPYMDGITWRFIPEESTIASGLRTGEIDATDSSLTDDLAAFEEDPELEVHTQPDNMFRMFTFNMDRPGRPEDHEAVFQDRRFREALTKAIPRQEWIDTRRQGHGIPAYGMYSPAMPGDYYREPEERFSNPVEVEKDAYTDPDEDVHAYDPERARELLQEVDDDIGIPDDFEMEWLSWSAREDDGILMGVYFAEIFDAIGLEDFWTNNAVPAAQYQELSSQSEMDIQPLANYGALDPDEFVGFMWHSDPNIGQWNHEMIGTYTTEWQDEIDELLEEQSRELDVERRRELLWELEDLVVQEVVPALFVKHLDMMVVSRDNIHDWTMQSSYLWYENAYISE